MCSRKFTDDNHHFIVKENEIINNLKINKLIGKGGYGKVYLVNQEQTHKESIIKIIKNKPSYLAASLREINLLIRLEKYYATTYKGKRELTTLYLNNFDYGGHKFIQQKRYGSDLYKETINKKISFNESFVIIKDIILGIDFLKKNKIIHGDLKPENILFIDDISLHVVICDFGLSMDISEVNKNYNIQSMWYKAPEVLFEMDYDYSIDVWSLGCIIFEIINGNSIFKGNKSVILFKYLLGFLGCPSKCYQETNVIIRHYFNLNNKPIYTLDKKDQYIMNSKKEFINNYENNTIIDLILKTLTWRKEDRLTIEECVELISNEI